MWLITLTLAAAIVAADENPVVVVETNFGNIRIELLPSSSPISVANSEKPTPSKKGMSSRPSRVKPEIVVDTGICRSRKTRAPSRLSIERKDTGVNQTSNA